MPTATQIAEFADALLRTKEVPDYPTALNGLQVSTGANVTKVAAAVDFSARTVSGARKAGAQLLIVHHGAFWAGAVPITGARHKVLAELLGNAIGVYSSHLPLDCHRDLGNNALLAKKLGLEATSAFAKFKDISVGVAGESAMPLDDLINAVKVFSQVHGGSARVSPHGRNRVVGRWGLCTGAGVDADTLREAEERGIKTLISGEGPHWTSVYAEENDIVLIYAGHYATETLGVQALADAIAKEFRIDWEFIEAPTGS